MRFGKIFAAIPKEIKYIIFLFLTTRIVLTMIGVSSRIIMNKYDGYSNKLWLAIWGIWDTSWYLNIVKDWYPPTISGNWSFFPLYPGLVKLISVVIGNPFIVGLIISNVALLFACYFLYKLTNLDYDASTSLNSVKYLFLFPTAFIFSGFFTESLFLALAIACFYYARTRKWWVVGILGFFLSLTRSLGVFILLPMAIEYFTSCNYKFSNIKKNILFLCLIPLGLAFFLVYTHYLTGDFLAYAHAQQKGWGVHTGNPFQTFDSLFDSGFIRRFESIFTLVCLLLLFIFSSQIRVSYLIFGLYSILIPLYAINTVWSMPRHLLEVFPFFVIFAIIGRNKTSDQILTIALALTQGFLMMVWAMGYNLIV